MLTMAVRSDLVYELHCVCNCGTGTQQSTEQFRHDSLLSSKQSYDSSDGVCCLGNGQGSWRPGTTWSASVNRLSTTTPRSRAEL